MDGWEVDWYACAMRVLGSDIPAKLDKASQLMRPADYYPPRYHLADGRSTGTLMIDTRSTPTLYLYLGIHQPVWDWD